MAKFHIKEDGTPGPCTAEVKACPNGGEHYDSKEDARSGAEQKLEQSFGQFAPQKKKVRAYNSAVVSMVDRDGSEFRKGYVKSIDDKHFATGGHGSKFTDPRVTKTEDVVELALRSRGSLAGDDREALIALGADRKAFKDGIRYLKVDVSGVEALKSTTEMADDELITVRAKGKSTPERPASLSFVAKVKEQASTSHATVIFGANPDAPDKEVLWTMFPGHATSSPRSDDVRNAGLEDGTQISVKNLRELFGDFKVNTEVATS